MCIFLLVQAAHRLFPQKAVVDFATACGLQPPCVIAWSISEYHRSPHHCTNRTQTRQLSRVDSRFARSAYPQRFRSIIPSQGQETKSMHSARSSFFHKWVATAGTVVLVSLATANAQTSGVLTHHVRQATITAQAQVMGRMPAAQTMQVDVVLPVRDAAGLKTFVSQVNNPKSPLYQKYLTSAQFTQLFGPTQKDYNATVEYLKSYGLKVVGGSRDGMDVQVKGPVSAVECGIPGDHAERTSIRRKTARSLARIASPRRTCRSAVACVGTGQLLDSASAVCEEERLRGGARDQSREVVTHATTGSGPSASFLGSDMRAAYYGGTADGRGAEPWAVGVCRHGPCGPHDLLQERGADEQCADVAVLDRRHEHGCVASRRATATTRSKRST